MRRALASRRPEVLLTLFTVGYLVALSLQVRHGDQTALGAFSLTLFRPALSAYGVASSFTREGLDAYLWQRDAALRSEALARENAALKIHLSQAEVKERENDRLRALLGVSPPPGSRLVGARALMHYGEPFGRTLFVQCDNLSSAAATGAPVLVPEGLVGKVHSASGGHFRVHLVTDPNLSVGVKSERTGVLGVAAGDGKRVNVRYIINEADVAVEDRFLTSGEDGLFPPGIPVGIVEEVADGGDYLKRIQMRPCAQLDDLGWVLLAVKPGA